jgi:hypothetical protein
MRYISFDNLMNESLSFRTILTKVTFVTVRYISFDNLMNESLSFRTILTKVTFVTASVAYLMLDPTYFVIRMPLGTFILLHVLVKCHLEAFVALP